MSHARFSVRYDGPALADHMMDVRDLAPTLLAVGELFDAANAALNGDLTAIRVNVRAHEPGCFTIDLDVVQSWLRQGVALLSGENVTAAVNLKELLLIPSVGLIWLLRRTRGRKPDRVERLSSDTVRLTFGTETFDVPLKLLRLYQDIAVRGAVERVVQQPLSREGYQSVEFAEQGTLLVRVEKEEAFAFIAPHLEDTLIVDDVRRAAFSIISLAFKEDNKWRLHDGQNPISATIADTDFLRRVDENLISFAKGDILVCEVRTKQSQTAKGLHTEHVVERVIEHRPAPRQLQLDIESFDPSRERDKAA